MDRKSTEDEGALGKKKNRDIRLEGMKLNQRESFVYLGGVVCGDGGKEMEIRRIQAGASAWRKVEGVMGNIYLGS